MSIFNKYNSPLTGIKSIIEMVGVVELKQGKYKINLDYRCEEGREEGREGG
jgi:hypothetical protein